MGVIHWALDLTTAGASIRGTAQQLSDAGLGDFWQESSDSFVTTSETFTNRSYAITEQVVGDSAIGYYGSTPGTNLTYTGLLILGYHDTTASNALVFSEMKYYQAGRDVSLTIADDRLNIPVADSFTFTMSKRADGSVVANNNIYVSDVDVVNFAFDIEPIVGDGVVVSTISDIAVSPTGALAVTARGTQNTLAILQTDGAQAAGISYTVTCNVLTSAAETIELSGVIMTAS